MAYPQTKVTFSDPSGTTRMDTGIDHAALHTSINDTVEALEDTVGTTPATALFGSFGATDKPAKKNNESFGTVNVTGGTINLARFTGGTIDTTSISGTLAGLHTGTASFTAGTLNNVTLGTPAITGGTATNINLAAGTLTGGVSLLSNGSLTLTGTADHITLTPGTGKHLRTTILRQDGTTNAFVANTSTLTGFKPIMVANGQSVGTLHIDFGGTFAVAPIVIAQVGGFTTAGSPASITALTTGISGVGFTQGFGWDSVTTTGFNVSLKASGNAGADSWYGVTWIAAGVLT